MGAQQSKKFFIFEWILLAFGVLVTIVASQWKPGSVEESHAVWFQRSGSIAVLCSLLVEFRINFRALLESYFPKEAPSDCTISQQIENWHEKGYPIGCLHRVALILATGGTAIWGYGDLLCNLVVK